MASCNSRSTKRIIPGIASKLGKRRTAMKNTVAASKALRDRIKSKVL